MAIPENENTPTGPVKKRRTNRISVLNEEFDLSLFILIAQKKWKLLVTIILIALTGDVLYLRYAQRVYEESCLIQIGSQNNANKVLNNNSNGLFQTSENDVAEAVELMRSKVFLEKVFKSLPMQVSYYTEGTFKNHEKYLTSPYRVELDSNAMFNLRKAKIYIKFTSPASGRFSLNKAVGPKNSFAFQNEQWTSIPQGKIKIMVLAPSEIESAIGSLSKDVEFFQVNDYSDLAKKYVSQVSVKAINSEAKTIGISCSDYDDRKAADIANKIGQIYIADVLEKSRESAEQILSFVDQQLDTIYGKIRATEKELAQYQATKKIQPNQEVVAASSAHLSTIEDQITASELDQGMLVHVENLISTDKELDPIKLITQLGVIDEAGQLKDYLEKLHGMINQKYEALNDITPDNKRIIELNNDIANQKNIIFQSLDALNDKLKTKIEQLTKQEAEIIGEEISTNNVDNIEYLRLQRAVTIDEKYYDDLLDKKAEYAISKAGYVPESEILDYATPVWVPVAPKKSVSTIIAILIATAIMIIILVFIYVFYNNITSVEEIERLSDSPITVLGIIPKYTKEIPTSQIIVNHNPKSILAESFRSIRTNLQFLSADTGSKIISITSTISGEGKTFVSVNLGGIIAYSGRKVIILDLDMRRPRIHSAFGMENSKGMSTLLIGKYQVEDVIQKTETDSLDVITAGPIPPNPSELVISPIMDQILNKLKTMYDVIIVDNPPVGLVTDGIAMLRRADYPIYLIRVDYSKREFIYFIDRLYYENQFHKLSVILNGVDFKRQKYGYSYYKYGYYGYGYGYGYTYGHGNYYET